MKAICIGGPWAGHTLDLVPESLPTLARSRRPHVNVPGPNRQIFVYRLEPVCPETDDTQWVLIPEHQTFAEAVTLLIDHYAATVTADKPEEFDKLPLGYFATSGA